MGSRGLPCDYLDFGKFWPMNPPCEMHSGVSAQSTQQLSCQSLFSLCLDTKLACLPRGYGSLSKGINIKLLRQRTSRANLLQCSSHKSQFTICIGRALT